MSNAESDKRASIAVDRVMIHDLVNHLTIALGHSDLLLMDPAPDEASRAALTEIRDACQRAVDLVDGWRAHLPPEE